MSAIIFAIISYIGWGTGDIFGAIASRKIGAYVTTFWVFVFGLILFSFYIPFAINDLKNITLPMLLLNICLGAIVVAGNVAINEAFCRSNASLVGTIASSFAAVTVVLSVIFLHERISSLQILYIGVIFLGVLLATLNFSDLKNGNMLKDRGVQLALFCMIGWGIYFTFIKLPVAQYGWFWPNYIAFWWFPAIFIYLKKNRIPVESPRKNKALIPIAASTFLLRSGDFAFNYGISHGLTSVVAPIAGAYPTLFAVLAFFVFKDKLSKQQLTGIICSLTGIVLLSFFS